MRDFRKYLFVVLVSWSTQGVGGIERDWQSMRKQLVEEIIEDTYRTREYLGKSRLSEQVLAAIGKVERHKFVPESFRHRAYGSYPLPIGDDQTISQPFIVALMTDLLKVNKSSRVLELGTGSGYQAAVLAELVDEVYTIEIVGSLAIRAQTKLETLGYRNVFVRHGDGVLGWPEKAPFEGIIVTAAGISIPQHLVDQLKPGGRLVMPVGGQNEVQQLKTLTKRSDGSLVEDNVLPVRFVPITGEIR
ncbi:MAG TPA: protein-L-isoaspartate O-methyltransferase [Gammaproteobacteria bacterium]|nr:protein-L-isoaspartate O-methyltransferase [Gammaproteobacteria bacterium]